MSNKYKIGDKVVPVSKSIDGPLEASGVWKRCVAAREGYLVVIRIRDGTDISHATFLGVPVYVCRAASDNPVVGGDFFLEEDLRLYEEGSEELIPGEEYYCSDLSQMEAQLQADRQAIPREVYLGSVDGVHLFARGSRKSILGPLTAGRVAVTLAAWKYAAKPRKDAVTEMSLAQVESLLQDAGFIKGKLAIKDKA